MSWNTNAKSIGPVSTLNHWDERIREELRTAESLAPHCIEQIKQVDCLVRNEVRRVQDASQFGEWKFEIYANGHADDPSREGATTLSVQIQWKRRTE